MHTRIHTFILDVCMFVYDACTEYHKCCPDLTEQIIGMRSLFLMRDSSQRLQVEIATRVMDDFWDILYIYLRNYYYYKISKRERERETLL